ncbi:MAG: YbhB/YbcL family Raf kinase inhibitor-like protein [Rickettsiales bacterium]
MRHLIQTICCFSTLAIATASYAAPASLSVQVDGLADGAPVPDVLALCVSTSDGRSGPGRNMRPAIHWSGAPKGTQSFAVFMVDPDVPADFTDAGKPGKIIPAEAARRDFYHYAVVNIPADTEQLAGGETGTPAPVGRELTNDLGSYVSTPTQFGGPCPPWNDKRLHHYHFRVLALPTATVNLPATTTAKQAWQALSPKALAMGQVTGTYTLNMPMKP